MQKAFQEYYKDHGSHCYGCGRLNEYGLHIKSYWDGDRTICHFKPKSYHTAIPGIVYGGLIASIIDCHGTGSAAAASYKAEGLEMGSSTEIRFVTASLQVNYLQPTPINNSITLYGVIEEIKTKKVIVSIDLISNGNICAIGKVIAIRMPKKFLNL